jgi:UDP-N-acetylmuramate dehydrogenase
LKAVTPTLADALGAISGLTVKPNEPLARYTTFRIGGPAEWLLEVSTQAALVALLRLLRRADVPFHLLGLGSNVLIPDAGLPGVTAKLGGELRRARVRGTLVSAGGALALPQLAKRMARRGLVGLEALTGFPSTVGGGVCMNAGCYGTEIKDLLVSVTAIERDGTRRRLTVADLQPAYRQTTLQKSGAIVTRAVLRLTPGDAKAALARIDELNARRWASLPSGLPNAGSIFKNPPGDYAGRLIEACGLKGLTAGGAQVSPKHANVIVNLGNAKATDVLDLMLRSRAAVSARFGVRLEPELVLAGELARRWSEAG